MITVYIITWNEELMLPYTINFYRRRFPHCRIVIYDNFSNDRTREIALRNNCDLMDFYTANTISDSTYLLIKNNCWKEATTDWVLVCDCDEWLDIWPADLAGPHTLIRSQLVVMVGNSTDISCITRGYRWTTFDGKIACFNRAAIQEINYDYGCHNCEPIGKILFSGRAADMYHQKYPNLEYLLNRYEVYKSRLSMKNKRLGLGIQYLFSKRKLKKEYLWYLKRATYIDPYINKPR